MKKIISILVVVLIMMFTFCSCGNSTIDSIIDPEKDSLSRGWDNRTDSEYNTPYQILLNSGSCFVYTFRDEATGVWYISSSKGVTPRLNADGSLYVE